jgi:lipopolysaccharide transport system ATP-binding protein
MSDIAIRVEGLGKRYRIGERERYKALRDVITDAAAAPFRKLRSAFSNNHSNGNGANGNGHSSLITHNSSLVPADSQSDLFWALRDVSFEVKRGEVVGIIGRNGAGKSTLLKILSRITAPTTGEVEIKGRVGSLLEVGTGFHPELTGRENIYLNGAILGMKRAEINRKFDEMVAFAEIEKFIDTPVKRYSSGMYVRLAFAVAAHLDPEILLVDEVLAVGDAQFQKKCLGKMGDVAKQGRTILFVSHNMGAVGALTQQCLHLESGYLSAQGVSRNIIDAYFTKSLQKRYGRSIDLEFYRRDLSCESAVKITRISVNGIEGESAVLPRLELGTKFTIEIHLDVIKTLEGANLTILLKKLGGELVTVLVSWDRGHAISAEPGRHTVVADVNNLALAPGTYCVDVGVDTSIETKAHDTILDFPLFDVVNTGQVTYWLERPWGVLHSNEVNWRTI